MIKAACETMMDYLIELNFTHVCCLSQNNLITEVLHWKPDHCSFNNIR